ncbi:MAG: sulfotransferase [Gemmatimonadetes bacterium]|nr:sulfotransferase [Gemmatimonadota bacterium]
MESPVFIHAPMVRSGTNYLSRLIRLNPVFEIPRPVYEGRLLVHAELLREYSNLTAASWSQWMDESTDPDDVSAGLLQGLGHGILHHLNSLLTPGKRLLIKTPWSLNLDLFFPLFPHAKLLLLVRDGRDTVESTMRSFDGRKYEESMRSWASGARRILDFTDGARIGPASTPWRLLKYEDLVKEPEERMDEVFSFLDEATDAGTEVDDVPVVGSSSHRGDSEEVHWEPLEKPANFNPIGRWEGWPDRLKRTFEKLAGQELVDLGYEAPGSNWW